MRIQGADLKRAGWLARILAHFTRRGINQITGKDVLPDASLAAAHHPAFMAGVTGMEYAQMRIHSVPQKLKILASLATSRRVGCPF